MKEKKSVYYIIIPLSFALLIWLIKIFEYSSNIQFVKWGIYPMKLSGLKGVLTAPLLHGSFDHLLSNTFPLIILSSGIIYFYKNAAKNTILIIYFGTNILVWLFARQAYHIGSSGLIYGFVTFLFFSESASCPNLPSTLPTYNHTFIHPFTPLLCIHPDFQNQVRLPRHISYKDLTF